VSDAGWLYRKAVLIGVGLIGGSMGMALRERNLVKELWGYDQRPEVLIKALAKGAIDRATPKLEEAVMDADLVILAAPVRQSVALLAEIAPLLKEEATVTDVCSTKKIIVMEAFRVGIARSFIGGHPMAGSERAGVTAASSILLENAIYILTPVKETDQGKLACFKQLIYGIGAQPLILSSAEHDLLTAQVSHLPHLAAVALVEAVRKSSGNGEKALTLAAGGFRDTTRVAMSNPEIWADICLTNKEAILKVLPFFYRELERLQRLICSGKEGELKTVFAEARSFRERVPYRGKGILPPLYELILLVPDSPGVIGKVATLLGEAGVNIAEIEILRVREQEGGMRLAFRDEEERLAAFEILKKYEYKVYRK
jgi:prephenate dehydrogenase